MEGGQGGGAEVRKEVLQRGGSDREEKGNESGRMPGRKLREGFQDMQENHIEVSTQNR